MKELSWLTIDLLLGRSGIYTAVTTP